MSARITANIITGGETIIVKLDTAARGPEGPPGPPGEVSETVTWENVTAKPAWTATFDGSYGSLTGLPTLFDGAYSSLSGIPATFAPSVHDHDAAAIVSGTIATAQLASGTANSTTFLRGDQTWQEISAGGATTFTGLTDTPAAYTGQAGKLVKVDPTGQFLIFGDPSGSTVSWGDINGDITNQTDLTPAAIGAAPAMPPSGNPYLQAYLDRLAASSFDTTRFDRKLHDDIFDAAGPMMEDCHALLVDRGAFEFIERASNVTISIASPGVVSWTAHGLVVADPIIFQTTGALPTGIVAGQTYYVQNVPNNDTFRISETPFGAAINTSGSQSGTHSVSMTRQDINKWINAAQNNNATQVPANYTTFRSYGFPLTPFLRTDGSVQVKSSANSGSYFELAGNPFTEKHMIFMLFEQEEVDLTFATVADMDADINHPAGTTARINNAATGEYGIYVKNHAPGIGSWVLRDPELVNRIGSSGDRYQLTLKNTLATNSPPVTIDKLSLFALNATSVGVNPLINEGVYGGGKILIAIYGDGAQLEIYVNGKKERRMADGLGSFANLGGLQLLRYNINSCSAICVFKEANVSRFERIHDAIAVNYLMPKIEKKPLILGFSLSGQSRASGATVVSSPGWATARGWNGETTGNFKNSPSIQTTGEWLASRGAIPDSLVETIFQTQVLGTRSMNPQLGSDGIVFGFAEQILARNPEYTGWLGAWGVGGTPISALRKPAGDKVLSTLLTPVPTSFYERGIRQILLAKQYADSIGHRFEMGCFVWMHGESDSTNENYTSDVLALYDEFNADCKKITGQSSDVVMLIDTQTFSEDGISNKAFLGNLRQIAVILGRGSRPIFPVAPGYPISNFIHWPSRGYRWQGEQFGKVWNRIRHGDGNFTGLRIASATLEASAVLLTFDVPVPPLQFDINTNNIESLLTNRGFEYDGGGLAITSVELVGTTQVRINLDGAPQAGHTVAYVKGNRYGNLCDTDATAPLFADQDWSQNVWPAPASADGLPNDLRNWCFPFELTLT